MAKYLDKVKAEAERNGYTTTLFGRRRPFSGFRSPLPYIRAQAERMAINAPIQGTSADILKMAMVRIDRMLEKEKLSDKVFMLLSIHDELIFEMEKGSVDIALPKIKEIMEEVMPKEKAEGVPILVDSSTGKNWGEL